MNKLKTLLSLSVVSVGCLSCLAPLVLLTSCNEPATNVSQELKIANINNVQVDINQSINIVPVIKLNDKTISSENLASGETLSFSLVYLDENMSSLPDGLTLNSNGTITGSSSVNLPEFSLKLVASYKENSTSEEVTAESNTFSIKVAALTFSAPLPNLEFQYNSTINNTNPISLKLGNKELAINQHPVFSFYGDGANNTTLTSLPGLTLAPTTGVISGTLNLTSFPTNPISCAIQASLEVDEHTYTVVSNTFTINVVSNTGVSVTLPTQTNIVGKIGLPITPWQVNPATVTSNGQNVVSQCSVQYHLDNTDDLPNGLVYNSLNNTISGIPVAQSYEDITISLQAVVTGPYQGNSNIQTFTISIVDSTFGYYLKNGDDILGNDTISIGVNGSPVVITPVAMFDGTAVTDATCTLAIMQSELPVGMSCISNVISGSPTEELPNAEIKNYSVEATVTYTISGVAFSLSKPLTIQVANHIELEYDTLSFSSKGNIVGHLYKTVKYNNSTDLSEKTVVYKLVTDLTGTNVFSSDYFFINSSTGAVEGRHGDEGTVYPEYLYIKMEVKDGQDVLLASTVVSMAVDVYEP